MGGDDAMQTDDAVDIVASRAAASGMQINLHPLVLVNIADHITKLRVQTSNPNPNGMLCGQKGGAYDREDAKGRYACFLTPCVKPTAIDLVTRQGATRVTFKLTSTR